MSSPAKITAVAPVACAEGSQTPSPFEAWTTDVSSTRLAVLEVKRPCGPAGRAGGGHRVFGHVVRRQPGVQDDAGGLVLQECAGCEFHDAFQDAADLGQQFPLAGRPGSAARSPGPARLRRRGCRSAASLRRGGDRPQAVQGPPRDECRRRPRKGSELRRRRRRSGGAARASPAWSTSGDMVPSKSMATSRCSVPAMRRTASSSSGESVERGRCLARAGSALRSHRGPPFR